MSAPTKVSAALETAEAAECFPLCRVPHLETTGSRSSTVPSCSCQRSAGQAEVQCRKARPELRILPCVPCFVSFSLSLLSGLSHQDYSSILLSFPNTIAKGCVLSFPLAFSVPTNQQLLCQSRRPSSGRDSESPPSRLSPLSPVHLTSAGTFGLLISALSFPLTNPVSLTVSAIVTSFSHVT